MAVYGSFQHHLIARITSLGAPLKVSLDWLDQRRQLSKEIVDLLECQAVLQSLFWSLEHLFVLEEQRWRG